MAVVSSANIHSTEIKSVFQLRDMSFEYEPNCPAIKNISLTIAPGERVALMGANGCGKSTLLKILGGLQFATSGVVEAFGLPINSKELDNEQTAFTFRRNVGFIFQNSDAQLFSSTVEEEIAFGPLHMGLSHEETLQRVRDVSALTSIEHMLQRAPFQLSGGEKKRVALASVLACNPEVLLMDEPTAALDPRAQNWLLQLLDKLHNAGKTLIVATHDMETVTQIADRALIFREDHTLAADIPTSELRDNQDLLVEVNLIHEHIHRHGAVVHSHPHGHGGEHEHEHLL